MKYLFVTAIAFCLSASNVFAENPDPGGIDLQALEQAFAIENTWAKKEIKGPCGEIHLTDAQKATLKTAFLNHKKATIQSEAALKVAGLDYILALTDGAATRATADTAAGNLATAKAKIGTNHMNFGHEVLFDIISADQRTPALKCMHQIHEHMKAAKLKQACSKKPKHHHHP